MSPCLPRRGSGTGRCGLGRLARAALAGAVLLSSTASSPAAAGESDEPTTASSHSLAIYGRSPGALFRSAARTAAGVGGGAGARDTVWGWLLLQADLAYLVGLGNFGEARLGVGAQLPDSVAGSYQPAATGLLSLYFGDQLRFMSTDRPTPASDPAVAVGGQLELLRFVAQGQHVSLLAVGVGAALDLPDVGWLVQASLIEVGLTVF
jgi:hypothetical protein